MGFAYGTTAVAASAGRSFIGQMAKSDDFAAVHDQLASSNAAHATVQACHPATGSWCRSRSNNSSRPAICEYSRLRILNHVLLSRSLTYGPDFCFLDDALQVQLAYPLK